MIQEIDHNQRAHAEFGPSSLKYIAICPGYQGKDGTSAASEKGTRIHEALEVEDPSALHDDEEVRIYETILAERNLILDSVFGNKKPEIHNEIRLTLDLDARTPTFGTCDLFAVYGSHALMADYKTGISKIDPPLENWQAKAYALAAFQTFPDVETIQFVFIVPARTEELVGTFTRSMMGELRAAISNVVRQAESVRPLWATGAVDIETLNPTVHCRYCRHEERCPAMGAVCVEIAKRYRPDLLPDGPIASSEVEDPEMLEKLYTVAKIVENWASAIKNKATGLAMSGHEFETYKLRSMGALKKTVEKNYLAQLAVRYGLELSEVIEAADLTITQLAKVIHDKAPAKTKGATVKRFEEEAIELGIVEVGPTRYTLSSK